MDKTNYDALPENLKEDLRKIAKDALTVQDAVNLSGVVYSFAQAMTKLFEIQQVLPVEYQGTKWRNEHPIAVLYSSKIESLTASGDFMNFGAALNEAERLAKL